MGQLENKVIFITGAFGQAGQSAVKMFLNRGATVIANDYLEIGLFPEMRMLQEQFGPRRFLFIQADMFDETEVMAAMAQIERHFGRLDGTYHTAYATVEKPVLELSLAEWETTVKGTMTSTFLVCKYALPLMIRSGGGVILNTSSIQGERPHHGNPAYGAAKAGVNQFTRIVAMDYAAQGIRANVLVPGDFKTAEENRKLSEETRQYLRDNTLLRRSGSPDEISEVAAFLLSDASSYVTASLYTVDGGYRL